MNELVLPLGFGRGLPAETEAKHLKLFRDAGKAARREATDAYRLFGRYEDPEGGVSSNPDATYLRMTRWMYADFSLSPKIREALELGMKLRDTLSPLQLHYLALAESAASHVILSGMAKGEIRTELRARVRALWQGLAAQMWMILGVTPAKKARKK